MNFPHKTAILILQILAHQIRLVQAKPKWLSMLVAEYCRWHSGCLLVHGKPDASKSATSKLVIPHISIDRLQADLGCLSYHLLNNNVKDVNVRNGWHKSLGVSFSIVILQDHLYSSPLSCLGIPHLSAMKAVSYLGTEC